MPPRSGNDALPILHAQDQRALVHERRRGLRMSLSAYVDESGKFHDGNGFICLCAWLSDHRGWETFNTDWNHLLAKSRLSGIHMSNFIRTAACEVLIA
jgi:hypothetical protein